jgi:hypothetical protein
VVAVDTRASGLMRELKSSRNLASSAELFSFVSPGQMPLLPVRKWVLRGCFRSLTPGPAAVLVDELDRMAIDAREPPAIPRLLLTPGQSSSSEICLIESSGPNAKGPEQRPGLIVLAID